MTKIYCEAKHCSNYGKGICQRKITLLYLVDDKFGKQVNCREITKDKARINNSPKAEKP